MVCGGRRGGAVIRAYGEVCQLHTTHHLHIWRRVAQWVRMACVQWEGCWFKSLDWKSDFTIWAPKKGSETLISPGTG